MPAEEALRFGFVASVYKDVSEVWKKLEQISDFGIGSIKANKKLMRKFTIEELEAACIAEQEELTERSKSEEALMAMVKFAESKAMKSKL